MNSQEFVSRFVRAGAYKMHYIEWGDGMPVVMVHGGGPGAAGEFGWGHNVGALGRHGRAIAVDQIGFGLSDKPLDKEFSHQFMAEQLAVFIDTLCLDEVYLTGNSMGAYVAARYALDHPGRVKKLLLVSSGTIATGMGIEMGATPGMKKLVAYDGTKEGLRNFISGIQHHPERISEERLEKRWQYAQLPGVPEVQASFLNFFRNRRVNDPQAAQWFDLRHRLPKLDIPMHFIWGRHDVFATPEMADQLKELLPNATFEWFEDSGHVCQNDEPDRYNEVALKFFFAHETDRDVIAAAPSG
ncbi:MAG: alpha/beta fold hydrolase [Gammaproteobacteria bacterium]